MFRIFHEKVGEHTVQRVIMEGALDNNLPKHGMSVLIDERNRSQIDYLSTKMDTKFMSNRSKE